LDVEESTVMKMPSLSLACALALALPLGLSLTAGCKDESGGSAGTTPSASASAAVGAPSVSAVASASVSAPPRRPPMRHHAGLAGALLRGAYDLTLTDEQRAAIDKLEETQGDAGTGEAATPWGARRTFQQDLVAGIRATKLDTTKLQGDYAALDKAVAAALAHEAEALDGLHGVLDATQRQALADQIKSRRAQHPPPPTTMPDGGAIDFHKRRLDRYSAELALDDAQKKQVAALIARDPATTATMQARREASQKRVDALLAEFVKDPFDAKKLDLSTGGKTPHEYEESQATFIAGLLPVLHPDQREKLAVRTERSGNRPGRMGSPDEEAMPFGTDEDMMNMPPRLR
jgi:Spy/CpxP family protein refolding chaperone